MAKDTILIISVYGFLCFSCCGGLFFMVGIQLAIRQAVLSLPIVQRARERKIAALYDVLEDEKKRRKK